MALYKYTSFPFPFLTNRAQRRVTSLIRPTPLPLRQTKRQCKVPRNHTMDVVGIIEQKSCAISCCPRHTEWNGDRRPSFTRILKLQIITKQAQHPAILAIRCNEKYKYVSGDWPISTYADLRPHAARYSTNGVSLAWRLRWAFTPWTLLPRGWPIRPILGFRKSKVFQNGRFPAQDADEPPSKIWRR